MSKEINWSIIHGEGTIECECDQCGCNYDYEFENGYPDFKDCQAQLRTMGWISKKIGSEWYDFCCKECADEFN